jgi:AraC-like DNA-binding protein
MLHSERVVPSISPAPQANGLLFVQRCQVAAGLAVLEDDTEHLSSVWECLDHFPRDPVICSLPEQTLAATAVYHLALGALAQRHREYTDARAVGSRRRTVNALMRLLREEYGNPELTLLWCSRRLAVSPSYLSRAIAAESGYHFPAHTNGVRLLAAIRQLLDEECRIKWIAYTVGYRDTREIDRQFQRRFGLSPRQYQDLVLRIRHDMSFILAFMIPSLLP